ncbi:DUF2939 domain-containing protein [Hyphomicrobium sp. CS1GBMeth3]|uniref:DUF2939 domain-containing protein n=1 Tax=Hyphomicrobium sp. CS1GBMeth3 TaxID=1892845 RepID=UPI0009311414|nr:DUF2939 domain-containing protein [Hyphomicrobium sp. CS1GBMeth3]
MRKYLISLAGALVLATGYVAYPLITVWHIREAVRTGNTAYIDAKIEWPTVRETLRSSLTEYALGPTPVVASGAHPPKPGLWQRIKAGISRRAVDNIVESYVTPEGLPRLFGAREFHRENISGEAAALRAQPWHERARGFWSRVKRAEFHSPTTFEIEMADKNDPARHYVGLLRLRGLEWKLAELRVRSVQTAPA